MDYWFFSNQVVGGITTFRSLGPLVGYSTYTLPGTLDHSVTLNELDGGYVIQVSMRRSRWNAVKKVLEKLRREEVVALEVDEGFFEEKGDLACKA